MQTMSQSQDSKRTATRKGLSVFDCLGLMFIGLKLTGYIAWSWWFVLCPFWLPPVIAMMIGIVIGTIGAYRKVAHNRRDAGVR